MKPLYPDRVQRILIRGTNWVGDAVMSIPALREVRRIFSRSYITLLVRPWVRDVYSSVDFVNEVAAYDNQGAHRGWSGFRRLASELRGRDFDLAILLPNAVGAAILAWFAHIPIRVGYARDGRGPFLTHAGRIDSEVLKVHQIYYYLGILSTVGLLPQRLWLNRDYRPSIKVSVRDEDLLAAEEMLREKGVAPGEPVVGLNPGASYGPAKRWLSDRYARVADRLIDKYGVRVIILGSPDERAIAEEVASHMKNKPILLAGLTTLGQLMALIKRCHLLITNDSGPMHLAAALDVPQLAIFGSTSEIATGPLSPQGRVIKHPVECSPCFLRECPIDFRCMARISVEEVFAAAEQNLVQKGRMTGV